MTLGKYSCGTGDRFDRQSRAQHQAIQKAGEIYNYCEALEGREKDKLYN